jgi:hypothetical protein
MHKASPAIVFLAMLPAPVCLTSATSGAHSILQLMFLPVMHTSGTQMNLSVMHTAFLANIPGILSAPV